MKKSPTVDSPGSSVLHRRIRVIVVEDEQRLRDLLGRVLTDWGFAVQIACTGEAAIDSMETESADVAIIDLNLPGMNGLDVLRQMRRCWPSIQAIILTGHATVYAVTEGLRLGIIEFLTKPCHLGELESALDRAVRRIRPAFAEADDPVMPPSQVATLENVEREHILAALIRNHGNRTAAATELGISRRTLYYKMEEYERQGIQTTQTMSRHEPLARNASTDKDR